jgi:pyruvate dehydrogenase E2 component (dihydrolipoamide acetyltransferase)
MKDAGKVQPLYRKVAAPARTGTSENLSGHQRSVAQALVHSKSHIPHYYLTSEILVDRMLRWREEHQQNGGQKVAFDSLFLYAVSRVLKRLQRFNGTFDKDKLFIHGEINLGFAVAAGEELIVPVIRNTGYKEVREIDTEVQWLAAKAKNGRIENEDQAYGTFTISNLGMYAVREFAAIINPPQVAILAFGEIHQILHIGAGGAMNVRSAMAVTGSFDHRAINGAQAAEFMTLLKNMIEEELW